MFAGEVTALEVYTLGSARLTAEQRQPVAELALNDSEDIARGARYAQQIEVARLTLPLLIKSWDVTWKGEPLPIEVINELDEAGQRKYPIPDDFVVQVNRAIIEDLADPTTPEESLSSSGQTATLETPMAVQ
ncbi:MAG TPA: hypothetical protein VFX97_16885 [Pyrinomonadaceae bacterium]|nr:hypothetical protein [Pyrinomonadaceae bacterium]